MATCSKRRAIDPKAVLTAAASLAASAMLARTIINDFIPDQLREIISSKFNDVTRHFSSHITFVIEEFQGFTLNQVFEAAHVYLGTKLNASACRIRVGKSEKDKTLTTSIDRNEEMVDVFGGNIQVKWKLVCVMVEASVDHSHSRGDLNAYILERSETLKHQSKVITLHTVNYGRWNSETLNLDHPMSFDTLALDAELKRSLIEDLNSFINRKEFYRRIGKAWKRGYLLYGPPGTGKSSLIAAMARYLNYDIYDLDLTDVDCNSDLRTLLLNMTNKSILVVEDIDCNIEFIDGLWSSCGDERIIVFTTNHKEKLDPALLRPGRMDLHIHMSYCRFSAEVAGELMKSNDDAELALQGLLKFLKTSCKIGKKKKSNSFLWRSDNHTPSKSKNLAP